MLIFEINILIFMRMVGLEPTRGRPRKILSLVRLPFRHIRSTPNILSPFSLIVNYFFLYLRIFFTPFLFHYFVR